MINRTLNRLQSVTLGDLIGFGLCSVLAVTSLVILAEFTALFKFYVAIRAIG